ncbi:MAG: hypothetical protein JST62_04560, partial [Bacteroidetes bacterium]|nr:hypothetical protein [Bacteroidota bacterium]
NHDWYDGLTAFYRMMAQQNLIGNYKTIQNRSYFAYHLGFNKHIFGLDNQLKGDLDIPQVDYFKRYVSQICRPGVVHHIILLVAEPYWYSFVANDFKKRRQRLDSLDYFVNMIKSTAKEKNYTNPTIVNIDIVITGDMHHYSHYQLQNEESKDRVQHYITSGGGGAFGHVTGFLKSKITLPKLGFSTTEFDDYHIKEKFPTANKSNKFVGKNLLFFWRNYKFTSLVIFLSLFINYLQTLTNNLFATILLIIFVPTILLGTVIQVANPEPSEKEKRNNKFLYSLLFISTVSISLFFCYFKMFLARYIFPSNPDISYILQSIIPALVQSFLMGVYFWVAYRFFGLHITEISSGKIQEGYKNFLKFKITKSEITIFVIGIKEKYNWWDLLQKKKETLLQKELIEDVIFDEEGEDTFLKKHFDNYKDNLKIIETINIKTP